MKQDGRYGKKLNAVFVGGRWNGIEVDHNTLLKLGNGGFTERYSQAKNSNELLINLDLEDQPKVSGYVGPMLDGGQLRYETQEVYDILSN